MRRHLLVSTLGLCLAVLPTPALAQEVELTPCIELLQTTWSDLVRAPLPSRVGEETSDSSVITIPIVPSPPVLDPETGERTIDEPPPPPPFHDDPVSDVLAALSDICLDEREPLLNISLLHANRLAGMGDFHAALGLLERVTPEPDDNVFGAYYATWLKLHWAQVQLRDGLRSYEDPMPSEALSGYEAARAQLLELHERQLQAEGLLPEEPVEIAGATVRGYRLPDDAPSEVELTEGQARGWILIVAMPNGAIERINAVTSEWMSEGEHPALRMQMIQCSRSGGGIDEGGLRFDGSLDYEQVIATLEAHLTRDPADDERYIAPSPPGMPRFCPNLAQILPGLGMEYEFLGTEYRDPEAAYSEIDIVASLQSEDAETRDSAAEYLLDHPDLVEPINLIFAVGNLLNRGDMERATFWFYIWQTRTRPWMTPEGGQAQVRGALAATVGPIVNEWAGSDFDALRQIYVRAIRYELAFPLYSGRPDGFSEDEWLDVIAVAREQNSEESILEMLDGRGAEGLAEQRRENGLPVGPWESPGRPLKDEWIIGNDD